MPTIGKAPSRVEDLLEELVEKISVDVPVVHVNPEMPVVRVAAPTVNVEAPAVSVSPPNVYVAAPTVTLASPEVTVQKQTNPWLFTVTRNDQGLITSILAEPQEEDWRKHP